MKAPFRHVKPVACGARSRAYRANCVLPLGHDGQCFTGSHSFVACVSPTSADVARGLEACSDVRALTLRQRQTAWAIAHGLAASELADAMGVSESTAKHHIQTLRDAFAARTKAQVLVRILDEGLMSLGDMTAEVMP